MNKINRSVIMATAWRIKKNMHITISEALKSSWNMYKESQLTIENIKCNRLVVKRVGDFYELTITDCDFHFTLKKIKSFESRSYNTDTKKWIVPVSDSYQLENFLRNF